MQGKVLSVKCSKSVVVVVKRSYLHPIYGKRVQSASKVMAHDDLGVKVGDEVLLDSSRPISKRKKHRIKEVL